MKKSSVVDPTSCNSGTAAKYKGVRKRKWGKWVCEIRLPNSRDRIWLGSHDSPEKAARAFDAAQFCLRGSAANFNFPNNTPDIAGARSMTPAEIQAFAARFANMPVEQTADIRQGTAEEEEEEESTTTSYSPSISDGVTAQMENEVAGVEWSFCDQMSLFTTLGSGNYGLDFGSFTGFDEFNNSGNFFSPQPDNFDYGIEDVYDASVYQGSSLWNF